MALNKLLDNNPAVEFNASSFIRDQKILIIVPAFNEEGHIFQTVQEICSRFPACSVLIVNDGSQDQTSFQAKRTDAFVVNLPFNLGIGGAVQTGFKFAYENDYDIAVQVDGDGQHDVTYLNDLLMPVISEEADMTIGSRFLPPFLGYRSSFIRRIGIHFFAYLISLISEYKVTDPTSGFRAYNRKMIKVFSQYYPSDYPEPEAIVVAGRYRAQIKEIPVQMRKRTTGHSSIRYLNTLYYMIKVTIAILLDRLKKVKK